LAQHKDKVALVTGASAGIGLATGKALAAAGWAVVGASRRGAAPPGCEAIVMDVDDDRSVAEGVASALERHGHIDALVACAGWGLGGPVETTPVADAKAQVETNFWGAVRAAQAVLPGMRAQHAGRIVFISSIGGVIALPFQGFYSASKFALEGLAEAMAYEVEPFGVKVTLVQPGNVRTEFTEKRRLAPAPGSPVGSDGPGDDPYAAALTKAIGTMGKDEQNGVAADDVAKVVLRVLESSRPRRRVSVGKAWERAGLVAKRALPFALFQAAAKGDLGV
jgi:NAD(P)-dependent dehydrogenase (short-subunit alcohol dehydrogenase family)